MATIANYFEQAQLSLAAYALDLLPGMSGVSSNSATYIASLKTAGMTQPQAETFANTYTVVDQYSDALSGFSATVFINGETGEYTFAVRGTEMDNNDLIFADFLGIVMDGQAQAQINAMNAYFGRLITPEAQGGQGLLDQNVVVNVAGHSLGGHLATAFTLFWRDHVNHTYNYNKH